MDSITTWFPRLHSLIFGPGLGRDPLVLSRVKKLVLAAKEMQKNIVIDAVRELNFLKFCDAGIISSAGRSILSYQRS